MQWEHIPEGSIILVSEEHFSEEVTDGSWVKLVEISMEEYSKKEGSLILIVWLNLVCKMIIFMVLNNLTLNYLLKLNLLDFTNLSLKIFSRFFISEIGRCLIVDGLIVTV